MKKTLLIIMIMLLLGTSVLLAGCERDDEVEQLPEEVEEAPEADEHTFFVSITGDDANPGTMDSPWKTFHKAVSEARPGMTIYVMEGVYTERLIIDKSGTRDKPITFIAYPGHEVKIDGEGMELESWGGLIKINKQNFIRVSGFKVINSPAMGIFACDSDYITIDNNYVYNTFAPGIHCWGDNYLTIDSNTLEWTCNEVDAPLECISLRRTTHFEVSNNHVFDSGAIGIDSAESFSNGKIYNNEVHDVGTGIYLDSWDQYGSDTVVYDNVCYNNDTGFAVNSENGGTVEGIKLYNNIAYGNERDGFTIGWGGVQGVDHIVRDLEIYSNKFYDNGRAGFSILGVNMGQVDDVTFCNNLIYGNTEIGIGIAGVAQDNLFYSIKNITVINNTVFNNGSDDVWSGGGIFIANPEETGGSMENIIIANNIVCQNVQFSIAVWPHGTQPVNIKIQNNLIENYMYDVNGYGETKGNDCVLGNPQFEDAANNDFHLTAKSPAIDAGTLNDAPKVDFDGVERPQGEEIDIGAYEFNRQ